ncbi:lipoprotein-releasing ABC transporter permease subunit [Pseudidiomarina sp. 1APP75-32.1]|uniref:Lipoprotein-releasing ABC transporter permease subunit n=1 Tax=Pseudidiomarina terrestris TaxID=2820060 RepID=A0AAW7QY94_9GAMM|nr:MULTISPECIES: lipoprotein-releasing ABC transporter permease subunit [unclassified Pseudidiomarina]MDN7124043.1 lipoprotein-releasing ABC transporter permease subunit [Pseudidiomarina sp. 1APP75-32.1]MDN7127115.1 lipoprotein-releasing ABC transporter permease subunit [Pseudidiomarina sp. 1APR75-33.1]MDN7128300.1 lipoprotein-releasing ABC transporter permease subunit [Pseudidiomarina sp. 1APR75-15]MEA3586790.1 lipoprotein-releasing ABC transporter permease subunit [Pseudidiomarina sp. 1APP75-
MFQPLSLFLGLRYTRARHGQGFTRFIQRVSLVGLILGVAALILVGSVMNGFEAELKNRILSVVPQLEVTNEDSQQDTLADWQELIEGLPEFAGQRAVVPEVTTAGLVQGKQQLHAVSVQGVFPQHADSAIQLQPLREHLSAGQLDLSEGSYHVILGYSLAQQLNVWPGEQVRLVAAGGGIYTPLGLVPAQRLVTVAGVVRMQSEADQHLVVMNGADLARLLRMAKDRVTGVRYYFADPFQALPAAEQLQRQVAAPLQVKSWRENYGHLFDAVSMEKRMINLMLGLIIAVAAFNIVSSLMMVVQDKRSDIAILNTMGLAPHKLRRMIIMQGLTTGVIGSSLGLASGLLISAYVNEILRAFGVDLSFAGPAGLPVVIDAWQVSATVIAALALTFLATLFPAWQASRVLPAHALRYE